MVSSDVSGSPVPAELSIVFATHNGAHTLPRMLASLEQLHYPRERLQIIAVDNASSDRTREILESFRAVLPLTVLQQAARGKNKALNTALPHVTGELVVFTDDDVIARSDWLQALLACAQRHPECDLFGGNIEPLWEVPPPEWLTMNDLQGTSFGLAGEEGPVSPFCIWGPNMMVRRRVLKHHRFNDEIGPSSGLYVMGSETEFNFRLVSSGVKTWFCPQAVVQHIARPYQLRKAWLLKRAYRYGRHMRHREGLEGRHQPVRWMLGQLAFPRWMARSILQHALAGAWNLLLGRTTAGIGRVWECYILAGYMREAQAAQQDSGGKTLYRQAGQTR